MGELLPDRERIVAMAGQLAQSAGGVLVDSLRAATLGTTNFLLQLFLMLYAMFFFLTGGPRILERILYLVPLSPEDEHRLLDRFVSVTRATIKGSLVIGVLQGAMAGLSFLAAGIPGAAFWGTVMAVLSIVPALGTALVLGAGGHLAVVHAGRSWRASWSVSGAASWSAPWTTSFGRASSGVTPGCRISSSC